MIRLIRYLLVLALGLAVAQARAEENSIVGAVDYINPATLEISISGKLYRLDNNTQIQGASGADLVQRMDGLSVGMQVQAESAGSGSNSLRSLRVLPE